MRQISRKQSQVVNGNKREINTREIFFGVVISVYLVMVFSSFVGSMVLMFKPTEGNPKQPEIDLIQKEVDRSYNRFFSQFNFAIFLIGTSAWIFRKSVVEQVRRDVEQDVMEQVKKQSSEMLQMAYLVEVDRCEAMLNDDPANSIAWVQKARYLKRLDRLKEALDCCEEAIAISPEYAKAYYNKSCYLALRHEAELSVDSLRQAIRLENKYHTMAERDSDFDSIRDNKLFKDLLSESSASSKKG